MKKIAGLLAVLLVVMALTSCVTAQVPVTSNNSFPSDGKYEVLGRVTVESSQASSGYLLLLEEAKRQYPEADDIVNIMVDAKKTSLFFVMDVYTYEMTAIAIKYN